jgi:hypothetical protein
VRTVASWIGGVNPKLDGCWWADRPTNPGKHLEAI